MLIGPISERTHRRTDSCHHSFESAVENEALPFVGGA